MLDQNLISSVRESLAPAQTVFILLPQKPSLDEIAASLALFLSLKKAGKQATIACPSQMTVEFSALVGVNQIQTKLGGRDLTISFDYIEDSIEKVSYNIENNKFNLVIQPKVGFPPLSPEKVDYSYSGGEANLIFTVGAQDLKDLGQLYQDAKSLFQKQPVVDIDVNSANRRFGKVNLIDPTASSCSEIIANLISRLGLPADEDIASNLLLGIEKTTKGFSSPKIGAATFEAAAFCLRAGARRAAPRQRPEKKPKKKVPLKPMPTQVSAAKKPEEPAAEEEPISVEAPTGKAGKKKPSPDWLEPKIYKGNTKI